MDSVLVSFSGRPVTDEIMGICRAEIAKVERLHAHTSIWRVTLDDARRRTGGAAGREPVRLYDVHVVVNVPGGELLVRRTPPSEATSETVADALGGAFSAIRRTLADYWSRRVPAERLPA